MDPLGYDPATFAAAVPKLLRVAIEGQVLRLSV